MASMTITTSFLSGGSATYAATSRPLGTSRRGGSLVVRASKDEPERTSLNAEDNNSRRGLMFAVTAMAMCSMAKVAMADEPKRGTPEAKQKYAAVCVTNPTARICRY